jgi:hypothetical protein
MKAESLLIRNINLLEDHLIDCFKKGFKPTLALVFCSDSYDFQRLSMVFDCFNIDVVGSTTAGEISNDLLTENGITCLLMDMPKQYYSIGFERNIDGVFETGKKLRLFGQSKFDNPSFIICASGIGSDGDKILEGFKDGYDNEISIFGGLAGGDVKSNKTHVFTRYIQSSDGIATIIFDSDYIEVAGLATSGWEALGNFNKVTRSENNIIYTINNEPALDFLMRFMYNDKSVDLFENRDLIAHQYPFQLVKDNDCEVLRLPISANVKDKSVTLTGSVKEGNLFRFSISPSVEVVNQTVKEFEKFYESVPDADALILFSCIGRFSAFGPFLEDEVKGIYDLWKKPMVGFLTYGEFGNLKNGICQFHNETCSLVTIRQK